VVHEHPAAADERVAVGSRGRRRGSGAHVGEEQVRTDVPAEVAQVLVRPGRANLAIEAGFRVLAVPAEAETVAVGGGGRFERPDALLDQRMRRGGDVVFERDRLPAIGNPTAHSAFSIRRRTWELARNTDSEC